MTWSLNIQIPPSHSSQESDVCFVDRSKRLRSQLTCPAERLDFISAQDTNRYRHDQPRKETPEQTRQEHGEGES